MQVIDKKIDGMHEVIPPNISDETMRKMSEFFMEHSIPHTSSEEHADKERS